MADDTLMDLIDAYAEARHVGGCHTYNAKTAEARAKVVASLAASAGSEPVAWQAEHQSGEWVNRETPTIPSTGIYTGRIRPLYTHPSPLGGMAGWKDIATAPRDGTPIWLYTASGQCEGYWNYGEWVQDAVYCTYDGAGGPAFQCNPTHWQPLPAPPLHASEAKEL